MKTISLLVVLGFATIWFACSRKSETDYGKEIKIYLIALDASKHQGKVIGCNDLLVAIEKDVNVEKSPLESAITELLNTKDTEELKNYVKGIQLMLFQVTMAGGVADVYLNGELTINGTCDIPRIREQLNETAKQFTDLNKVNFYLNAKPLESYLDVAQQGFK